MRAAGTLGPGPALFGVGAPVFEEEVGEPLAAARAGIAVGLKAFRQTGAAGIVAFEVLGTLVQDQRPGRVLLRVVEVGHGRILAPIVIGATRGAAVE